MTSHTPAPASWSHLDAIIGRSVSVLGSTGSIGTQALEVIAAAAADRGQDVFRVRALAAGRSRLDLLAQQAVDFDVEVVATSGDADDAARLAQLIAQRADAAGRRRAAPEILHGPQAAVRAAQVPGTDLVLNGITGSIGLEPTVAALAADKLVALANKESLIAGGPLIRRAVAESAHADPLIPVDSEHSALAQALRSGTEAEVARLVLTASGGPFRGYDAARLATVTPQQALAHPTWDMGMMVTTNSATMVNKALEVLEAHLLFGVELERIEAVVHPQSVVHSMVEFVDGSTIAQASPPDMRLPIALGLAWPHRLPGAARACDWSQASTWTFEPLDEQAFPAIALIKEAAAAGESGPAVFNAANEEAVHAFHAGAISFPRIMGVIESVLGEHDPVRLQQPGDVTEVERWARRRAQELAGL